MVEVVIYALCQPIRSIFDCFFNMDMLTSDLMRREKGRSPLSPGFFPDLGIEISLKGGYNRRSRIIFTAAMNLPLHLEYNSYKLYYTLIQCNYFSLTENNKTEPPVSSLFHSTSR